MSQGFALTQHLTLQYEQIRLQSMVKHFELNTVAYHSELSWMLLNVHHTSHSAWTTLPNHQSWYICFAYSLSIANWSVNVCMHCAAILCFTVCCDSTSTCRCAMHWNLAVAVWIDFPVTAVSLWLCFAFALWNTQWHVLQIPSEYIHTNYKYTVSCFIGHTTQLSFFEITVLRHTRQSSTICRWHNTAIWFSSTIYIII